MNSVEAVCVDKAVCNSVDVTQLAGLLMLSSRQLSWQDSDTMKLAGALIEQIVLFAAFRKACLVICGVSGKLECFLRQRICL